MLANHENAGGLPGTWLLQRTCHADRRAHVASMTWEPHARVGTRSSAQGLLRAWMPRAHPADIVLEDGQVLQDVVLHRAHVRRAHLPPATALHSAAQHALLVARNQSISC